MIHQIHCTPRNTEPGQIDPDPDIPAAWEVGGRFFVNVDNIPDYPEGVHRAAFLIGHELLHDLVYPPGDLTPWVYLDITAFESGKNDMALRQAFAVQMDIVVNETMIRDHNFVRHLARSGIDFYKGINDQYESFDTWSPTNPTTSDAQLQDEVLRYFQLAIWRETDPSKFNAINPKPRFNLLSNMVTELVGKNGRNNKYRSWGGNEWFLYVRNGILLTHDILAGDLP